MTHYRLFRRRRILGLNDQSYRIIVSNYFQSARQNGPFNHGLLGGLRPQSSVSPSAAAGPRSAGASPRTGVGSDDSPLATASITARVSPSARRS